VTELTRDIAILPDSKSSLPASTSLCIHTSLTPHGLTLWIRFDPVPGPNYTQGWDPRETVEPFTGGDISTPTLQYFGKYDLLAWMNKYWVSNAGDNYVFWQHEFSKHGVSFVGGVFGGRCESGTGG
jgi:hypothetical protein